MAAKLRKPLCEEGKNALLKIVRADPVVYQTLVSVIKKAILGAFLQMGAVAAAGIFSSSLFGETAQISLLHWISLAVGAFLLFASYLVNRKRERDLSRCVADINQTLREDIIVQIHTNPVGGMYENDSYSVMKARGEQIEELCDELTEFSGRVFEFLLAVVASVYILLLNPVAGIPALLLCVLRSVKLYRTMNMLDDLDDKIEEEERRYKDRCDELIASGAGLEPDDIALSRVKAASALEELEASGARLHGSLYRHRVVTALFIILLAGLISIAFRAWGIVSWYGTALIIPSILLISVALFCSGDYYGFYRTLADTEWTAIDLTTIK